MTIIYVNALFHMSTDKLDDSFFVLTPDSYAWLRRQMSEAKRMLDEGSTLVVKSEVESDFKLFNAIHAKALELYGKAALDASCKYPSGRDYAQGQMVNPAELRRQHMPEEFVQTFRDEIGGLELVLRSGRVIKIVSHPTGRDNEISIESLTVINSVLDAFPGAYVNDVKRKPLH
jgi:hypothetical protein